MAELKTIQIHKDLYAELSQRRDKTGIPITRQVSDAVRAALKMAVEKKKC